MKSLDSIPYYNQHADRLFELELKLKERGEILPFCEQLRVGARVLDLGCGSGVELQAFKRLQFNPSGIEGAAKRAEIARKLNPGIEVLEKNLLFLSLALNAWDGIWIGQTLNHFEPETAQRIVGACFQGIVQDGILGVVVEEGTGAYLDRELDLTGPSRYVHPWNENALCSMIEQTGFSVLKVGKKKAPGQKAQMLILAKKISLK